MEIHCMVHAIRTWLILAIKEYYFFGCFWKYIVIFLSSAVLFSVCCLFFINNLFAVKIHSSLPWSKKIHILMIYSHKLKYIDLRNSMLFFLFWILFVMVNKFSPTSSSLLYTITTCNFLRNWIIFFLFEQKIMNMVRMLSCLLETKRYSYFKTFQIK